MATASTEKYTARMHTGSRTYFFDIKLGASGDLRLEVSESRKREGGFQKDRLTVFEEDVAKFTSELLKAVSHMADAHGQCAVRAEEPKSQNPPRYAEIRQRHTNAYRKWTPEEDEQLLAEIAARTPMSEIARSHGRQPGAIRSRIDKLME